MTYCYIANYVELQGVTELLNYYETNIVKIANILKTKEENIPKDIGLFFELGEGAGYSREEKRIIYRFKRENELFNDKGRLIHEATHVVQDYPFKLDTKHTCWCWVEGIADYCRLKLDNEFSLGTNLSHEPKMGYKEAAHFLVWMSKNYPSIIPELNLLFRNKGDKINGHDQIFTQLIKKRYNDLRRDYIYDQYNNLG